MERPFDIITFDCYGTLIDWESGISKAFLDVAAQDGITFERDAILSAYAAIEPAVEHESFRSYRTVLAETARQVAARLGWALPGEQAGFLAASLPHWQPFSDTNAALKLLAQGGYRLGILSNVDDDLLAGTRQRFDVDFDLLVTAQQVGSYKPATGHFLVARKRIGDERWLHAAQSYFHDIVPAKALGVPVAWINRKSEPPSGEARPDYEFHTLIDLAAWLAPAADSD